MALFPAADDGPAALSRACGAAVGATAEALRRAGPDLRFGVGLDAGLVTHGNVGSPARLGFNVVGTPVDRAARLEGLTKRLGAPLAFARAVADALPPALPVRPLGAHALQEGLAAAQEVFSLASLDP